MSPRGITPSISAMIGCGFNRWTVTGYGGRDPRGRPLVNVKCSCGHIPSHPVDASNVKRGRSKSCGCLQMEVAVSCNTTHGLTGDLTLARCHNAWRRCCDESLEAYQYYGGHPTNPVHIAREWQCDLATMRAHIVSAIGECPGERYHLDRIGLVGRDGKWLGGNYEPGNVRWATFEQSAQNRGTPSTNTSGVKGVRVGRDGYVYGKVTANGVEWHRNFGRHTPETWALAVETTRAKRIEMHGDYANHG